MKRILLIFIAVMCAGIAFGQDPTIGVYNDQRGGFFIKAKNIPAWQIDGYNIAIRNGDTLKRIRNAGAVTAEELNILPNGSDMTSQINTVMAISAIKEVRFVSDSSRSITVSGSANFQGKSLVFGNGMNIVGSGTITNAVVDASDYAHIFDTTLSFTNLKSTSGYLTPQMFGAKGDGVTDDLGYWKKAAQIAADNGLKFVIPSGSSYINGVLNFKTNGSLIGAVGSRIKMGANAAFRFSSQTDNVTIENNNIEVVSGGVNQDIINLGIDGVMSYGLVIKNNIIQAHRRSSSSIVVQFVDGVLIQGNRIDSSYNKGIEFRTVNNSTIMNNYVTNSGRSGIVVHSGSSNVSVINNTSINSAQNLNFNDGAFDVYGGNNYNLRIDGNYGEVGGDTYGGGQLHNIFRIQGANGLQFNNNTAVSKSTHLLYAIRFASRDSAFMRNIQASGNTVRIMGGGNYDRIISFQDVYNASFKNYRIIIDSNASAASSPAVFFFSTGAFIDTIGTVDLSGGEIIGNGKLFSVFGHDTPIKRLIFNNTTVTGLTRDWYQTAVAKDIENMQWIGGNISSTTILRINNNIKSALVSGINYRNSSSNSMWTVQTSYTGKALIKHNIVNGMVALNYPADEEGTAYVTGSAYTVPDSISFVFKNRPNSDNYLTLPPVANHLNRTIGAKNIGSSAVRVYGVFLGDKDSLYAGEVGYWKALDTAWRWVGSAGGGGGGTINIPGFAYIKNLGKSVGDTLATQINDTTVGFQSVRVNALNNKVSVTPSGGDSANIYTVGVNEANFTGIPQSAITNLADTFAALHSAIGTGSTNYNTVYSVDNITERMIYLADSSINAAYPLQFQVRTGSLYSTNTLANVKVVGDYIEIDNASTYGVTTDYINTSVTKQFLIQQLVDSSGGGANVYVSLYNDNGFLLTDADGVFVTGSKSFAYGTTYGVGWVASNAAADDISITVPAKAKMIRVTFGRTTSGTARLKAYRILATSPTAAYVVNNYSNQSQYNLSPTVPTRGSYSLGKIIYNSAPHADSARGWICTSPGSFGTLTGVTGTLNTGTSAIMLLLNSGSGTKIQKGYWLNIAGTPIKVESVKGDTVWLSRFASSNLSAAAINFATPSFIPLSASGGGGSLPTKTAKYLLTGTGSAGYDTSGVRFDDGVVKMTKDRNEIRMYNTTDETTNYEYGSIRYQALGGIPGLIFESNKGGTGATGWLTWRINGVYKLSIDNNNTTFYTSFLMGTDNSYDFGRLSASPFRIRSAYIGTSVQSGSAANTTILARYHAGPATTGLAQLYFEDKTATPSSLSDGMLWRDGSALNYRIGGSTVNLLAGGGSGNLKTRVVDDANYTIADTVNAVIIRSASTGRTMTYPSASANVGREITIWNETDFQHFASTTIIYDSSFASAYLEPNTWVRAKSVWYPATSSYAWHAIGFGETAQRAFGYGTYTATVDSLFDINSTSAINLNWERKGDKVRVWGQFNVTTTNNSSDDCTATFSLPVPSTFALPSDCSGLAGTRSSVWSAPAAGVVWGRVDSDKARVFIGKVVGQSDLVVVNVAFDYIIR